MAQHPVDLLPAATTDLAEAFSDLETWGYCLLAEALSPAEVSLVRGRLVEQADAEAAVGLGRFDAGTFTKGHERGNGPNQRLVNLLNKGDEFHLVPVKAMALAVMEHILGERCLLSSYTANIAGPGGMPMELHQDQGYVPFPQPASSMVANIAWFLDDVTEFNGGTRIAPRSHLWTERLDGSHRPETIAAAGPAGTALVIPGRVWHGTGQNRSQHNRHVLLTNYCRVFVRQQENPFLGLAPDVQDNLTPELRRLLGYKVWGTLGGVENGLHYSDADGFVSRPSSFVRRLP
jgi:ectoine hydroxylase-related dioxygenase (phytanoyl-CoA dioxygenase family)